MSEIKYQKVTNVEENTPRAPPRRKSCSSKCLEMISHCLVKALQRIHSFRGK